MHALKRGGRGDLRVAHLNHGLRGRQSLGDQRFVESLCRQLNLPCDIERLAPGQLASAGADGLEAAARSARHSFLQRVASSRGARYVAIAHNADDQAETIFHRVVRGTGISGLSGMPRARSLGPASLIRPLLGFRRAELLAYLNDCKQAYRVDASNIDLRFTRNRIRHQIFPQLAEQFNPSVTDALLRLGRLAGEVQQVVDGLVEAYYQQSVCETSAGVCIAATSLKDMPRYLMRELLIAVWRRQDWPLQAMGYDQWEQLAAMVPTVIDEAGAAPAKQVFPGAVLAEVHGQSLHLHRKSAAE